MLNTEKLPDLIPIWPEAGRLGIGRDLTYRLARKNAFPIPVVRIGSAYRMSRTAFDRYIQRLAETPID